MSVLPLEGRHGAEAALVSRGTTIPLFCQDYFAPVARDSNVNNFFTTHKLTTVQTPGSATPPSSGLPGTSR